jgi:hypothetical protein
MVMATDEQLWYRMMDEPAKADPLAEARKKAQQEDIEAAKAEEQSFASKVGEMLTPPKPKEPQVDLTKVAEGTSQIPAISEVKEEEFEPLEVKPTTEDMRYAAQQRLQQFDLQKQITPEDPEKATKAAGLAGEIAAGFTPAGVAIDIKDMAKAVETKDPILAAAAGVGLIPGIGDAAKGTFKALRAGDRSVETVRAGRQLLEKVDHAERLWREMHTDSPYFRKWAGEDTPIVNAGDPLPEGPVVIRAYHGTPRAEFTEFDPSISREEIGGMHFGTPAQSADFTRTGGPPVMPLYIRMNNPLRLEDMGSWDNVRVFRQISSGHGLNPDWYHMSDDELIAFAETKYKGSSLQEIKATILRDPEFKVFKDRAELIGELKMDHYVENVVTPSLAEVPPGLGADYAAQHLDKSLLSEDMELAEQALAQELLSVDALEGGDLTLEEAQAFAADNYSRIRSENQNRFANRAFRAKAEAEFVQKTLRHHGHDGIVYENTSEGVSIDPSTRQNVYKDSYILFDPAKIKSTSNRGTFDPSNPDIMSAAPASLAGALDDSSVA